MPIILTHLFGLALSIGVFVLPALLAIRLFDAEKFAALALSLCAVAVLAVSVFVTAWLGPNWTSIFIGLAIGMVPLIFLVFAILEKLSVSTSLFAHITAFFTAQFAWVCGIWSKQEGAANVIYNVPEIVQLTVLKIGGGIGAGVPFKSLVGREAIAVMDVPDIIPMISRVIGKLILMGLDIFLSGHALLVATLIAAYLIHLLISAIFAIPIAMLHP